MYNRFARAVIIGILGVTFGTKRKRLGTEHSVACLMRLFRRGMDGYEEDDDNFF